MMLPIRKENNEITKEEDVIPKQVLTNLAEQYFTGKNADILKAFLAEFSIENISQVFELITGAINRHIDLETMSNSDIEQIDIIKLASEIAEEIGVNSFDRASKIELEEIEKKQFENALKDFTHTALHDVAFPMIAMENPNAAISAKNLIKRVVASMQDEGADISEVYETLDIENLPVQFSLEILQRLGGNIPGLQKSIESEQEEDESFGPSILYCALNDEQTIYLTHGLQEDYEVIKNWKSFYHLLQSKDIRKYNNVIVVSEKKELLLSILRLLYNKTTLTGGRFLRTNKNNGIWPFFEQYLINSKTDNVFSELRKIPCTDECKAKAKKIIDELFDTKNQLKIKETAIEIIKNKGI